MNYIEESNREAHPLFWTIFWICFITSMFLMLYQAILISPQKNEALREACNKADYTVVEGKWGSAAKCVDLQNGVIENTYRLNSDGYLEVVGR